MSFDFTGWFSPIINNLIIAALISATTIGIIGYLWRQHSKKTQAYSELLQLITEIERENPVRAGSMITHATGAQGPFPYSVHKKLSSAITEVIRKQGRYLRRSTKDLLCTTQGFQQPD